MHPRALAVGAPFLAACALSLEPVDPAADAALPQDANVSLDAVSSTDAGMPGAGPGPLAMRNKAFAVRNGGEVWSWNPPTRVGTFDDAIDVTADSQGFCALRADHSVTCGSTGATHVVPGLSDVAQIAGGSFTTCARQTSGAVWCWGVRLGDRAQRLDEAPVRVEGLDDAVDVALGWGFACAVRRGGMVACWGCNNFGELGDGTQRWSTTPVAVRAISAAVQVTAGRDHACVLRSDSAIQCWGVNYAGSLGAPEGTPQPVTVAGVPDVARVSAGSGSRCALTHAGAVFCWGENLYGQLGDGSTERRGTPTRVAGLDNAVALAVGYDAACAMRADDSIWCWGYRFESTPQRIAGLP